MPHESLKILSEEHWHELRSKHIGGSEAAILLGVEKYMSRYELVHLKRGTLEQDPLDSIRVKLGTHLESGILAAARDIHDVKLRKVHRYIRRTDIEGFGASMDAEEFIPDIGWVPTEIKLVAWNVWRDQWSQDDDGLVHVPLHINLQCQHYMAITDKPMAVLYVLVSGEKLERIVVERSDKIIHLMEEQIVAFWKEVHSDAEPQPDFSVDFDAMKRVMTNVAPPQPEDMQEDSVLTLLVADYAEASRKKKSAENRLEEIKARVLDRVGEYQVVLADGAKISAKLTPAKPETQVTYKAQPAKRSLRITLSKEAS